MSAAPQAKQSDRVVGTFRYLSEEAEPSLFRNGKVKTKRDVAGSDGQWVGCRFVDKQMPVYNARLLKGHDRPTLMAKGFEVLHRPVVGGATIDFLKNADVVLRYYLQCAELVRAATGASFAAAFDHNVRSASGKSSQQPIAGGQQVQGPAHVVHSDYTLTSSVKRLRDLAQPPSKNDQLKPVLAQHALLQTNDVECTLKSGRFAIINVWRNIADEPVQVNPLAICDSATVSTDEMVVFEIHYADRIGENYFAKHSDKHKWYYYPQMTKDEALLLKTWDSAGRLAKTRGASADAGSKSGEPCTFSFHSAFTDPSTPDDAPDRWSIEVRCVAIFDDEAKL